MYMYLQIWKVFFILNKDKVHEDMMVFLTWDEYFYAPGLNGPSEGM